MGDLQHGKYSSLSWISQRPSPFPVRFLWHAIFTYRRRFVTILHEITMKAKKVAAAVLVLSFAALLPALVQDDWKRSVDKMSSIIQLIEDHYFQDVDHEELAFSSIKGMLQTLDPHSYFLNPRRLTVMQEDYRGKYSGLGMLIQKHETRLVVISPIEGSPAYRLGIRAGDIISHIDGESTKYISSFDAMLKLRGERGTEVTITIVRDGLEKPLELTMVRDEIPLYSVPYAFMLDEEIGYIFIRNFAETTTSEFEEKMEELESQGMKKLILDMRGNTGGTFSESVRLSDEFLPKGRSIVAMRGRDSYFTREFSAEKDRQYEDIPLVILINQGTASAPEIVSGAIMDNDRGLIVGEDSWGKGLVQQVFPLAENAAIALTTAKYYTPSGRSIQRDYSAYEDYYIYRAEAPESEREVRFTAGGRKVLGQGGITPDYVVEFRYKPQTASLLLAGAFFSYGRKFSEKGTPLSKQYIFSEDREASGMESEERIVFDSDFTVDSRVLEDFKLFLLNEKIDFDAGLFEEAKAEIERELLREIFGNIWEIQEGIRAYRLTDPVVQKALEVMDQAADMVQK